MSAFKDQDAAVKTAKRIESLVHRDVSAFLLAAAETTSRPDQALVHFERWLSATGNPNTVMESVLAVPDVGRLLVTVFGASHQLADTLVQNPELGTLLLDPTNLAEPPNLQELRNGLDQLLADSTSFTHSLDRLRYFKQSWHARIAAADLGSVWPERDVWLALSLVAEALVAKSAEVVWSKDNQNECPITIIGMGKLGGLELNFSSDIDLVYALPDDADEGLEKQAEKFCKALNRALSDRMGRGALYRVDLRLRPFGGRGTLVSKIGAIEGYYERYAEAWEHLALVRSRPVTGDSETQARWKTMRDKTCFKPQRGEWFVAELLKMRARIEELHDEHDIKRASGGIRDVEFLTQILQLLHGHPHPDLKDLATTDALRRLAELGLLPKRAATDLADSYTFLRQVEHRIQILGDQQLHTVPRDDEARAELAKRAGFATLEAFDATLALHRANARSWYQTLLSDDKQESDRTAVLEKSGPMAPLVAQWIDAIPESEQFYRSLAENESSLNRILKIAGDAPVLVPQLRTSVTVTEQIVSGEVYERFEPKVTNAATARRAWQRTASRWALDPTFDLGNELSMVCDSLLEHLTQDTGLTVIALGSFGAREMTLYSDLDIVFWKSGPLDHENDERQAQKVLQRVAEFRQAGAYVELDLRLRPEGKKGRLVQNEDTFRQYESSSMLPWERLALGRTRARDGVPAVIKAAAYERPLDYETVQSLKAIKKRVETERVPVRYRKRHIKLGPGGQDDILWTVQILYWKHFKDLDLDATSTPARIQALANHGAINALECEQLHSAWADFMRLRLHLGLLGFADDIVPENPDKLARLGAVMDMGDTNSILAVYERYCAIVRSIFEDTLARLS